MITRATFLDAIENHLRTTGTTATAFGKEAMGDPNFVFDLRGGRVPNIDVVERVMAFMDKAKAA